MRVYYNDFDPYVCQWLENLIAAAEIPPGDVDNRPIQEVQPHEVKGYQQCHFFAGVGGWSYALQFAAWPEEWPIWTGSCPCQPFSAAGKGLGFDDERDLWPAFHRLISDIRPSIVVGEQVSGARGLEWLDRVFIDLESDSYAVGASDLPAAGVGAPHIRQRLWWLAYADSKRSQRPTNAARGGTGIETQERAIVIDSSRTCDRLADSARGRTRPITGERTEGIWQGGTNAPIASGATCGLGNSEHHGPLAKREPSGTQGKGRVFEPQGSSGGAWGNAGFIYEPRAELWRRIKPGLEPLANGIPARTPKLRAYGNAIVPQVAAVFLSAAMETISALESQS